MDPILTRIANLSPEKQRLLGRLLAKEGIDATRSLILPRPRGLGACPLSFAQQRLWFLSELSPGSPVYHIAFNARLEGTIDVTMLERCYDEIVRRHEVLRTTFDVVDGRPVQLIAPPSDQTFRSRVVDLRGRPAGEREAEAMALAVAAAREPFDLTRGPLLRAIWVRLADDDNLGLFTLHHIVADGWSIRVLLYELLALYEAYVAGRRSPLPELPIQYADFAIWQRQWLQGDVLQGHLDYWTTRLAGLAPLELPTDRPRPAVYRFGGARHPVTIPPAVSESLRALSQRAGVTLFMTLLAAYQTLLHRYTGEDDIAVGTPIANRSRAEISGLIGFFVNTLVLRTDLSGDPTFTELLERVKGVALGAYEHQDFPFERLVEELRPTRDLSHPPLFQTSLVLDHDALGSLDRPELRLTAGEVDNGTAKFDLTLSLIDDGHGVRGALEFNTDLFERDTAARMLAHLGTLLEGIVADPERRLSALPLLPASERERVLVEWTATRAGPPGDRCVHELFEARAREAPDAVALVFEDGHLTYAELNRRANRLAHRLRARGVGPEARVGLCVERSLELVVGILGILKAGGAYVPLDPGYPAERLAFMLDDAGLAALVTRQRLIASLPAHQAPVVCLDADEVSSGGECHDHAVRGATADQAAYVIYTSGSTGRPKGVLVSHRNVTRLLDATRDSFHFDAGDTWTLFHSYAFDFSVWELWGALGHGGRLVVIPDDVTRAPDVFYDLLVTQQVTVLNQTPSAFHQLQRVEDAALPAGTLALRLVVFGGEALNLEMLAPWLARHGAERPRLVNMYGITETTVHVTYHPIAPAPGSVIGRPIADLRAYVLDHRLEPAPIGVPGELHVGGPGLARGYLGQPALTAERFVPDPFGGEPGARLYRTGDRVRWLGQGDLEFLGRRDRQVKIRGYRIELGEIESVLARHPAVQATAVVDRADAAGDRRLAAYVIVRGRSSLPAGELRQFLQSQLPDYMVPSAFVFLDGLPLTPSGKVDYRALPGPDALRPELSSGFVAPRTPLEEMVAGIWAEVLGLDRVGVHDNFFDLGGHSLLATQMVARLRTAVPLALPLRAVFEAPTVAGLAEHLKTVQLGGPGRPMPAFERVSRQGELPLSFAQQRLWFLDQLEPASSAYNISGAVRLTGPLDVAALEKSFQEIVRRHEILRTTFVVIEGRPVQEIAATLPLDLPVVDLGELPQIEREAEVRRLTVAAAQRPFDLARGPLVRATLLRLASTEHVVLMSMHHIVSDGWSLGIIIREAAALYEAVVTGRPSPLPELALQYADFAVWQRRWLQGDALDELVTYWKRQVAGATPLELPTDWARPAVQVFQGGDRSLVLPESVSQGLRALSRREGVTPFMTLLAAFQTLLHRHSGQDDIVVGAPIANRHRSETEDLVGFFVNTLVLRADLSGNPSFRELLRRVREVALDAYAHQDLPFERLVECLQPQRDLGRTPLFQVFFNLLNVPMSEIELPGLTADVIVPIETASKFDLTLYVEDRGREFRLRLVYNAALFTDDRMGDMLEQLARLLSEVVHDPGQRIDHFSLVTPAARAVLPDPTDELPTDSDAAVHTLAAQQARRVPECVAVVDRDGAWTYQELDARSRRLAHCLRDHGIRPGDVVAIHADRCASLVLAVLGSLKAGAAFVLLDASYPSHRLIHALRASQPRGWLQIEGAGPLPESLDAHVTSMSCYRLAIPRCPDAADRLLVGQVDDEPGPEVGPDDLAYVTWTSGTTGVPKGILGTHRPLTHFVRWHSRTFGLTDRDRFAMLSGLSHDPLMRDLFTPLSLGATLCIPAPEDMGSPSRLLDWMKREAISVVHLTPGMGRLLADAMSDPSHALTNLRYVFFGGDVLTQHALGRMRQLAPAATCVNFYGATETPQGMGYFVVPDLENVAKGHLPDPRRKGTPLGRGIEGVQLLVLNGAGQLAGIGELGEIHVRTPYLSRGYLGDDPLTESRFVVNPFTGRRDDRLYKTGDQGRWRVDGALEYAGRRDQQVKIRGYRVELGEIETVLGQHPGVRDAVVAVHEEIPGDKRLIAYVVAGEPPVASQGELRRYLQEHLPDYMLPAAFVFLDGLPLTANGKVDRAVLPAPSTARPDLDAAYVAPRGPLEELVASVWAEVLGLDRVGVHDNFFDLGGHSLLATQVVARLRAVLPRDLPLRLVFEAPTVAALVAAWEGAGVGAPSLPALVRQPRDGELPLSFAQQRLWFLEQLHPGSPWYHVTAALRVSGPLDAPALERGLREVVRRHEALRTRFAVVAGQPTQVIDDGADLPLPVWDLSGLDEAPREDEARRRVLVEARRPFDLARGPLLRAGLLRLAEHEHIVLLVVHHIVADGWSLGLLVREAAAWYAALRQGEELRLPPLPIQYADYALWQRQWLRGDALAAQLAYWREQLADLAPLELPSDRPRPPVSRFEGARVSFRLSAEVSEQVSAVSRREGLTVFMTLLATFQVLLHRYTGRADIAVGSPIAGRTHVETEGLIGFFVNTLVLRTDLSGDPTVRELLGRVRRVALGAYAHQDVPFEKLVEELQQARDLSRMPLVQVLFQLQNAGLPVASVMGLTGELLEVDTATSRFDLCLSVVNTGERLEGNLEYSTALFDEARIMRLVGHFQSLLHGLVADPGRRLSELPLLTVEEEHQLLREWSTDRTGAPLPGNDAVERTVANLAPEEVDALLRALLGKRVSNE